MSMSGYDDNVKLVVQPLLSATDKEIHSKAVEAYRAEVQPLIDQIADLNSQIEKIKGQVIIEQAFLDRIYDDKAKAMQGQIDALQNQIQILTKQSQNIEADIAQKLIENHAIQTDFSNQQIEIDTQKEALRTQGIGLGQIQKQIDDRQKDLENKELQLAQDKSDFEKEVKERSDKIAVIELSTTNLQLANMRQKDDLDYQAHQQKIIEASLQNREDELIKKQIAAQILIDQAQSVADQKAINETRAVELDKQEAQLEVDINQIKATQIALDIQKAELAGRQSVIQAAEKKIATEA